MFKMDPNFTWRAATESVSQVYLNEIRQLKIECEAKTGLTIHLVQAFKDDIEFHRRDLNANEFLSPKALG
jgi:hypothetical protein